MKLCSDCKERERSWNTSLCYNACDQSWCENYINHQPKDEENIKIVSSEIAINENNNKKNKKFDLEIKIKQYDLRILEIQKSLFNMETARDELKRELKQL